MKRLLLLGVLFAGYWQQVEAIDDADLAGQAGMAFEAEALEPDNAPSDAASVAPLPQDNLEQVLADVEKRYGEIAATLRYLYKQIEQKRRNIDKIELEILACQRAIAKERKELAGQVKAAYEMGQQEELKLLLNQQDPALSSRMMIYYSYINKARLAKIAQLETSIQNLERWDKQKQAETQQLELDLQQKKMQQAALNGVRQQRKALLADMAATSYQEQLNYLAESENKLRALIASLPQELGIKASPPVPAATGEAAAGDGQAAVPDKGFADVQGGFSHLKGKLSWPVQGKVMRSASGLGAEGGVLIEAKEGLDVHAVAAGKITFADWMRSYGYLVIIDHGDGYMSLYAFNQSLFKQVNDTVKAGEVIASVGQSGGRSQPGLYFGIRKNAQPIDPLVWCRGY
ncbi:MAG: peptidoglycan DD-metalloendopeptidase family protein [Methylovulum sp.]|nr:peptidoglycan DD-metalloendopeptidase family protein [Methylovulum sp.]